MKKKTAGKSSTSRAKKSSIKDLTANADPKGGRVGGKMHLEDISMGLRQDPTVPKTQTQT